MACGPRFRPSSGALLAMLLGLTAGCEDDAPLGPTAEPTGLSVAYGRWTPGPGDTCSKAIHDAWSVTGPDGLSYPTWHPPVDPMTGCTFGHEHGRDPSGSHLFPLVGRIPFGYANQYLAASGFGSERHEDHVGHKVDWENDMPMRVGDGGSAVLDIRCDVLVKMHQGTHSPDAFTNNMHEVVYHVRCTDGSGFSATLLTPIGNPGELVVGCDRDRRIAVGAANPLNSPDGGGRRAIPDASCIDRHVVRSDGGRPRFDTALRESWEINASLRAEGGRTLASFNPYFQVLDPSRYFASSGPGRMGRPIELCSDAGIAGRDRCEGVSPGGEISWDDPRSPFKGTRRFVDINANNVRNEGGPTTWYTDPLGRNGQPFPFPGSIRQWVAARDNRGLDLHGPVIGRDRDYDAPGVHAPN